MYEIIKNICSANNWHFEYGRSDFQNLYDEVEDGENYVFLDPVKISQVVNDTSSVEGEKYTGSFMILKSSSVDEISYEERYLKYIKPIISNIVDVLRNSLVCDYNVEIKSWELTEVINIFDYNLDGIIITYDVYR